jgi:hypothetical protein
VGQTLIVVDGFEPVRRQHLDEAFYVLNPKDAALFEAAITSVQSQQIQHVVGYYRSHNRSGLFLSPDDLKLIQRHFRDPESVFLLIKPLSNGACTAGFFFWKDGFIQAECTNSEVPLIPLAASSAGADFIETAAAAAGPMDSRSAAAPFARAGVRDAGPRRISVFVLVGLALAALTGVLTHHTARHGPNVPIAPMRSLPKPVQQSASIFPRPAESERTLKLPGSITVPAQKQAVEKHLSTSKPFVLPPSDSHRAPSEISLKAVPPIEPAAPIVPPVPLMPESVVGRPVALPTEAPVTNAVNPPLTTPPASKTLPISSGPRVIHSVAPAVPHGVRPKITADVQVDVEVATDAKGTVTAARIVSTRGAAAELLTIEALKAAQLFRFQPSEENGHAVAGVTVLTFHFAQNAK